jgi:hypothetical protein
MMRDERGCHCATFIEHRAVDWLSDESGMFHVSEEDLRSKSYDPLLSGRCKWQNHDEANLGAPAW